MRSASFCEKESVSYAVIAGMRPWYRSCGCSEGTYRPRRGSVVRIVGWVWDLELGVGIDVNREVGALVSRGRQVQQ